MNENKKDGADSVIGSWPKAQGSDPAQVSKPSKIDELYESIQGPKEVAPSAPSKKDSELQRLIGTKEVAPSSTESLQVSLHGPKEVAPSTKASSTESLLHGRNEVAPSTKASSTESLLQGRNEVESLLYGPNEVAPSTKASSTESLQGRASSIESLLHGPKEVAPSTKASSTESLLGRLHGPIESLQGTKEVATSTKSKKDSELHRLIGPKEVAPSAPSKKASELLRPIGTNEIVPFAPAKKDPAELQSPIILRGPETPDELSFYSDLPQRSAKDSLPKTPESSSPMTNTPTIDEAQDSELLRPIGTNEIVPFAPAKKDPAELQSPIILRGPETPDELSFYSDLPQRSAKDSLPKTPESSSPMTNTPKIDEAQDVFPFRRMNVSEISQLLELPKNLHSLKIEGCDVLDDIPETVMASIPSLQRLYIINCCSLKSFPEPADLRILHIQNCKKLEFLPPAGKTNQYAFLEHLCIGNSCDSLTVLPLDLFPKLRCLSVWDCQNLNSLSIQEGNQKDLTSLEALEIRDCPELVKFPEGGLPTPNLTSIWLSNCNLKELPLQLRTTLTSLRSIFISKCPELVSLFKGDSASNLSLLSITSCDKLMPMREWGLHMLKCLIKLEIEGGCEDLESFPEEKLLPSNLKSLRVSRLLNLKSLDYKGLQHLTALKTLEISCCANLESLPEEGLPSSLSVLCIKECSLLKPKLQKQTGDYWPKIARISFIETDKEVISRKSPRSKQ